VAAQLGYPVLRLHRQAIGPIELGDLPVGHVRPLRPPELRFCQAVVRQVRSSHVDRPGDGPQPATQAP
jgi:16S rRNA U516 pseudouridylate synthase RsuA-like enzyme